MRKNVVAAFTKGLRPRVSAAMPVFGSGNEMLTLLAMKATQPKSGTKTHLAVQNFHTLSTGRLASPWNR